MTLGGWHSRVLALVVAGALILGAGGCTVNPATGEESFAPFMSPSDEIAVGREEHPKVLEEFGGAYSDGGIAAYVTSVGHLLAATSEMPKLPFVFTVLDSPAVNAFALPGGYVYITRGLMAIANSEAELAAVIAHEIGHVTARHTAQRYSQSVLANLGLAVLGAATQSSAVTQLANVGASLYLLGYSRGQEIEADRLGIRYLARAGYDPRAMASMLTQIEAEDALSARIAEKEGTAKPPEFLSTHPRTETRVAEAASAAQAIPNRPSAWDREIYLKRLDGLLWGDSPEEGFIKGRVFAHPELLFRFEAPPGFRLQNSAEAVVGEHENGAALIFDSDSISANQSIASYLVNDWAQGARLDGAEEVEINGMRAATARTRVGIEGRPYDARLVAIRFDPRTVYRFAFLTPPNATTAMSEDLRRATYSFRRLSPQEAAALKPRHLEIVSVRAGDTPESLARRMAVEDYPLETFRVLNGLKPGQGLEPGARVKLVVE